VVLIVLGMVIRASISEPETFVAARRDDKLAKSPLRTVFSEHRRSLLLVIGLRISQTAASYFFTVFVLFYLDHEVPEQKNVGVLAVTTSAALSLLTGPLRGALSDRVGRRKLFLAGAIGTAFYIVPFFLVVDTHSPILIFAGVLLGLNVSTTRCSTHSQPGSASCSRRTCGTAGRPSVTRLVRCSAAACCR
jgi:MHS family shikimate/dehydroshikimate transporter-like MFS transporter